MTQLPVNLFGHDRASLRAVLQDMGEKPFRADQLMQWIYQHGVADFGRMTNISTALRERLAAHCEVTAPEVLEQQTSSDGTRKWVVRVGEATGSQAVETVFIPDGNRVAGERWRGTLCISSQVGCAMDCSFCATGKQGFSRNLTTAEIVAQLWFAAHELGGVRSEPRAITNVVMMGMGEPLANYGQLVPALRIFLDDFGFGLSKRRVTVSTSGLVPYMDRLREDCDTALAVSLHAADDELRDELVPINRKYPLSELMGACRRYTEGRDRKMHIVYEYVMLDGVNDSDAQARDLARLLAGMPAKVNLIPFNPFPGTEYRRSPEARVQAFSERLRGKGVFATTRRTRGDDIDAACGQLVGRVQNRQKRRLGGVPVVVQ